MKKYIVIFTFLFFTILINPFYAFSQKMKLFKNKRDGYSIKLPDNWIFENSNPSASLDATQPKKNGEESILVNFGIVIEKTNGKNSVEYAKSFKATYDTTSGYTLLNTGEINLSGIESKYYLYKMEIKTEGGIFKAEEKFYTVLKDGYAYVLICTSDNFDKAAPLFEKIINTFKLK